MWTIIGALIIGIAVGWLNFLPDKVYNWTNKITMFGLIVLLFSMGLGIGSNAEILNHLDTLGVKAFAFALGSVLGSILVAWYLQTNVFRSEEK